MSSTPRPYYYPALTGLRAVAATMVFAVHNVTSLPASSPRLLVNMVREMHSSGIFFILSGFLIATYIEKHQLKRIRDYGQFILVRLIRIYPIYLLVYAVLYLQWLYFIPDFILHITLLKGFFSKVSLTGIVQTWSLTVEISFYLLSPFLFKALHKYSFFLVYGITFATGLLLTGLGIFLSHADLNPYGFLSGYKFSLLTTFFGRSTDIFAGIYLCKLLQNQKSRDIYWPKLPLPYTYLGIIAFLLVKYIITTFGNAQYVGATTWPGLLINNFLLPCCIMVVLYGLIREKTRVSLFLSSPILLSLGGASYIFYLIHLGWIRNWFNDNISGSIWLLFIFMWLLSISMHRVLEEPLNKQFKKLFRIR